MKRLLDALSRAWKLVRILIVLKTVRDFCGSGFTREEALSPNDLLAHKAPGR